MRDSMLSTVHFGHAGRDAMLRKASDVWWPRIHQERVEKAKGCPQCSQSGEKIKCLQRQKGFGKFLKLENPNDEISLDVGVHSKTQNLKNIYFGIGRQPIEVQMRWSSLSRQRIGLLNFCVSTYQKTVFLKELEPTPELYSRAKTIINVEGV